MNNMPKHVIKYANIVARNAGYGRATAIICSTTATKMFVKSHTPYGYRKNTTGEYVPNKYRRNFGWKNTYYQNAKTVVVIPVEFYQ